MGTRFLWDPVEDNIVKELDDSNTTLADYTTEPDLYGDLISQDRSGQSRFYQFDGQGSTMELTDGGGDVTDTRRYSAFGEATDSQGNSVYPFRYIGKYGYYSDDASSSYLVRRRPYHFSSVRWLAQDIVLARKWPNQYTYADNRPNDAIDPSGELAVIADGGTYSDIDMWRCQTILNSRRIGGIAGYSCAADLLAIFLGGDTSYLPCPPTCKTALEAQSKIPPITNIDEALKRIVDCGEWTSHYFKMKGSVSFYGSGDLHYSLGLANWETEVFAESTCGKAIGCCCTCKTDVGELKVNVSDKYDFCGTTTGGKFSPTNCGCALEKAGWGTTFNVNCAFTSPGRSGSVKACFPTQPLPKVVDTGVVK